MGGGLVVGNQFEGKHLHIIMEEFICKIINIPKDNNVKIMNIFGLLSIYPRKNPYEKNVKDNRRLTIILQE